MGTVLRVRHIELGIERALKLLTSRESPTGVQRFQREVAALAAVRHPNVVGIHDSGELRGLPWYAMDLIEGDPLDQLVERGGAMPLLRALELLEGIARGVDALHQRGVVHRDLKPQNVVITRDGRAVVLDLGLAIVPDRDQRLTRTGAMVGTPSYMAPEQLESTPVTPRTDVHALGLILFELVTGRVALQGMSVHDLMGKILDVERPRATELVPDLPLALDALLARAMARDAALRPATAGALAEQVAALRRAPRLVTASVRRRHLLLLGLLLALLAFVAAGACALAILGAPPAGPPTAASVGSVAPVSTAPARPAAPRALTAAELERAAGEARIALRVGATPKGRAQALRWLAAWGEAPERARVQALVREVDRAHPRAALVHAGAGPPAGRTLGRFVDDDHVVTFGRDGTLRAWRLRRETGEWFELARRRAMLEPAALIVHAVEGQRALVYIAQGGLVLRFDAASLEEVGQPLDLGRDESLVALAVAPDGESIAGVPHEEGARAPFPIYVSGWAGGPRTFVGQARSPARDVAFAGLDLLVAAYGDEVPREDAEQAVKAWSRAGELLWSKDVTARPYVIAFDGRERLAIGSGGQVLLTRRDGAPWQELVARGALGSGFTPLAHDGRVVGLAFNRDDRRLLSAANEVRVWDLAAGQEGAPALETEQDCAAFGLSISPDGALLLIGTDAGRVDVWAVPPQ